MFFIVGSILVLQVCTRRESMYSTCWPISHSCRGSENQMIPKHHTWRTIQGIVAPPAILEMVTTKVNQGFAKGFSHSTNVENSWWSPWNVIRRRPQIVKSTVEFPKFCWRDFCLKAKLKQLGMMGHNCHPILKDVNLICMAPNWTH